MATGTKTRRQGRWQCTPAAGTRRVGGPAAAATIAAVLSALTVALVAPASTAGATNPHGQTIRVSTARVPHVGTVLTTSSGLTLYRFAQDPAGMATCTGACAKIWPPLLASKNAHVAGPKGVKGLSLIKVTGGHWQVAFHNVALYRFEGDKKKGQAKGQGVESAWYAVLKSGLSSTSASLAPPASTPTTPAPTTTTQPPHAVTTSPPATQAPASPPPTTRPTQPPTTTPTTQPPATTTTTAPTNTGSGGAGF